MKTYRNGDYGEAKVLAYFLNLGYSVFTQFGGHAPFDMVVFADGKLQSVEVKSTETGVVQLKRVYSNTNENKIRNFDNTNVDLLAVYDAKNDCVKVFDAKKIENKSSMVLAPVA